MKAIKLLGLIFIISILGGCEKKASQETPYLEKKLWNELFPLAQ